MKTAEFDYHLPPEYIAQTPAEPRDSSKLMVLDRATGRIEHCIFREIGNYLRPGDLLVLNNTRVTPARLYARKARTGGRVEILLLEQQGPHTWRALVGGRKVHIGTVLKVLDANHQSAGIHAEIKALGTGGQRIVQFNRPTDDWLEELGHTPLPPYIHNYTGDPERYQTVYSRNKGSAAAPTAGLHFSPELLLNLRKMGVKLAYVNLRIGLDTFKPINAPDIHHHTIHTEWAHLGPEAAQQINQTRLAGGRVIAVGTTAVRTLETAAGGKTGTVSAFQGPTDLYITPGFRFQVVDAMITNFHLPRSTLIVLVSAFACAALTPEHTCAGLSTIKQAYATAIAHRYRFYSFGDAMLIL